MATFTNATKNTSTFENDSPGGKGLWSGANVAWDSTLFFWDSIETVWGNTAKDTTSFANLTKN